jgi:hypothetical protein
VIADNWLFVFAAYGLAAALLAGYWRHLVRREQALSSEEASAAPSETSPREEGAGKARGSRTSQGARRPRQTSPQEGAGEARARSGEERP